MSVLADWLYAQGHAIDLILGIVLLEALWLMRWQGWTLRAAAACLLPGVILLLALRAALVGMAWPWIALALVLSFPAHLADLMLRDRGGRARHGR